MQKHTNKLIYFSENALRENLFGTLAKKEDKNKGETTKIEHGRKCLKLKMSWPNHMRRKQ